MDKKLKIINDMTLSARLSFLVYLKYIIINVILFFVMGLLFFFSGYNGGEFKFTISVISIVYWVFVFFRIETAKIYTDKQGICAIYGVLPWRRRVDKISWEDLEEILYTPSVIGWLFQSYTIKLKSCLIEHDIIIANVWRGKHFVDKVNEKRLTIMRQSMAENQK